MVIKGNFSNDTEALICNFFRYFRYHYFLFCLFRYSAIQSSLRMHYRAFFKNA